MNSTLSSLVAACLLLAGCNTTQAPSDNATLSANQTDSKTATDTPQMESVSTYYQHLVSTTPMPLAELSLFLNEMPKGGDLHHHYSGSLYVETYLDWLDKQHYCVYRIDDSKTKAKKFKVETRADKLALFEKERELNSKKPDTEKTESTCLNYDEIQANNTFYRELLSVWSNKDFYNHAQLQQPPDKQFFDTFGYFGDVSDYSFETGLKIIKARAKQENIQYIETMLKSSPSVACPANLASQFSALSESSSDAQIEQAFDQLYTYLKNNAPNAQAINEFVRSVETAANTIDDAQFTMRFQAYVSRNSKPEKIFSGLYSSFAANKASTKIVGINFVGPENGYIAMRDYRLHMKMFQFLKKQFPDSKLSLHAGELVIGMVPPEGLTYHINDAIHLAGANRIGHGVDIANESDAADLLKLMREKDIAIEINLTSNEFILGVANNAHPLQLYRSQKVPFVISTDDSGVSRSNLSHEYFLFASRYKPSYPELKQTVFNSIRYSFLSANEKNTELANLNKRFDEFERSVEKNIQHK